MDSATIEKVATTVVIAGAAFAASKLFEAGWKLATGRPIPAEDADDVTMASLVLFAASSRPEPHTPRPLPRHLPCCSHERQEGPQVRALPRSAHRSTCHGLVPRKEPAREREPRARVGLHDGGRSATPVSRPRQDLHRARGRHAHLDRAARMQNAKLLESETDRRQHDRTRRLLAALNRVSPRAQRHHPLTRVNPSFRHTPILRGATTPAPGVHSDHFVRHNGCVQLPTRGPT